MKYLAIELRCYIYLWLIYKVIVYIYSSGEKEREQVSKKEVSYLFICFVRSSGCR